jgi:hypothetical protein
MIQTQREAAILWLGAIALNFVAFLLLALAIG